LYHAIYSDYTSKVIFPPPIGEDLSPGKRRAIVYLGEHGERSLDIAKSLKCSKASVNRILKRHRETGTTSPAKRTGRKPLLNSPARACLKA